MTKEVYIYIGLFVILLGYLVYMDYRDKTGAQKVSAANEVIIPYGVPQLSKRERDALENPKEGTTIYFMGDRKFPSGFQVFYRSELRKERGLPPEWIWLYPELHDGTIFQAEEDERRTTLQERELIQTVLESSETKMRTYLEQLAETVPHKSPHEVENPVEGMIVYREELRPLANEGHIPSLRELGLPFVIYANGIWQEISLGDTPTSPKKKIGEVEKTRKICAAPGCDSTAILRGFCGNHVPLEEEENK